LSDVFLFLIDPERTDFFYRALSATASSAAIGFISGALIGFGFTLVGKVLPWTANGLSKLAVALNSIPSIALAPIFIVLLSRGAAPAAVASIHVLFIMFVASTSGLNATAPVYRDLFSALGARRLLRLRLLELPSAFPAIATGLRLSAPVAIIGAIIGEWFGSSRGLGVLMVNAMQNFQITMLWSAIILAALLSLGTFVVLTTFERAVRLRYA
jgi:NitT/TauT family transport system permease protein